MTSAAMPYRFKGDRVEVEPWTRLIMLPSGDCIDPRDISSIRVTNERADPKTGVISATAIVGTGTSWFKIHFDHVDQANQFRVALFALVNWLHEPPKAIVRTLDPQRATDLIDSLRTPSEGHENDA